MTIWITGCTSGLGEALIPEFVKRGHAVVGGARRVERLKQLQAEYPESVFLPLDVSVEASCIEFCQKATSQLGAPDILLNNAAMINDNKPLWEISGEEFDLLMRVNVSGVANMLRHTIPIMAQAEAGILVNLSSGWGRSTSPDVAPYCASKWAIEGLSQALAQELPPGLSTVAMNPGIINTDMLQKTFGPGASQFPNAAQWAKTAAPFILNLNASNNGHAVTAP